MIKYTYQMRERKGIKMKTRKLLLTIIAVIALCLLMTATAFADTTTTPITLGTTVNGTFTAGNYQVYEYTFTLANSGNLKINFTSNSDDAIEYSLEEVVDADTDHINGGYIRKGDTPYEYELAAGNYVITLNNNYSSGNINFSFTTTFTKAKESYTGDNNSVNVVRKSDALPFGTRVYGHLAQNDEEDWYKIKLTSSGKLTIALHTAIKNVNLEIRDADEKYVAGGYVGKGDETFKYELIKGTYYIHFDQTDGYGAYNFKPTFTKSGETYQYENDSINLVRNKAAIPFATTIKGHFAIGDQQDYYKLSVPKAGKYTFKVTNNITKTTDFEVRTKNDEYVAEFFHDKGTKSYKVELKKGTYYLRFYKLSGDNGNYSFKVTPSAVSLKKLTKPSKGAIKVTWYKGTGNGYQIQYSTSSTFKSGNHTKLITSNTTTSKTIKSLKSKKTYYVRIRTYVTGSDGKKIYSNWSAKKKITTL